MAEYLPPTENLPIFDSESFKDSNNEFLTYDKANKYFLKFPNAQGTENFNTLSANEITAPGDLLLTPEGSVDMNGKVLNMTNGEIHNCPLIHSKNNEDIVIEGKGTGKVILKSDSTKVMDIGDFCIVYRPLFMDYDVNLYTFKILIKSITDGVTWSAIIHTEERVRLENYYLGGGIGFVTRDASGVSKNVLELTTASAIFRSPILMNDETSSNRVITSSLLALNETTGSYSPTVLHHIYQTGGTANYINYVNNGTTNLTVVNTMGSIVTPLTITPTSNNIPSNINLAMASGTGIINQGISNTGSSLSNIFKKSAISIISGSSTGSSTSGLEIYDESGGGKGLFILPNSGGGSLSNLNMVNDCALVSRSPQNNNAISITNWNSELRNGIRIFTTDINNCGLTIQCGNGVGSIFSELRMAFNKTLNTLTTSFNNPIDFNPTNLGAISPARRLLSGLGTLSFTDILGNTTGGTDTGTITNNSSATVPGMQYTSNLNTGSHNFIVSDASSKYNPFSINFQNIKHNVPTALADFSIGSSLTLAGGVIIGSSGINNINVNSNTNNRGIGNYTIPSRGTYIVIFNFKISTVSADTPFTNVSCGITSVQNVYNTAGQYSVGNNSVDNAFTLQHEGVNQYVSTCVLNIASPSTVIYFTYNLVFGTVAAVGIMNNYTITRIA